MQVENSRLVALHSSRVGFSEWARRIEGDGDRYHNAIINVADKVEGKTAADAKRDFGQVW